MINIQHAVHATHRAAALPISVFCGLLALMPTAVAQDELPEWLRARPGVGLVNRRDCQAMADLVRPVVSATGESIVQVICDGRAVALGTIVGADGYILTKRSELTGDPIRVRLADDQLLSARVAAVRRANDLALLHVDAAQDFRPVSFTSDSPAIGSFLISPGRDARSIDIGVVSSPARAIQHEGRLGVYLENDSDGRARVERVMPSSGAEVAGVVRDDRILAINGQSESSKNSVMRTLHAMFPGESVRLTIERSGATLELDARIREFGLMQESENDSKVNGPRNSRLSGFDLVLQHDTVLEPDECGGPILDSSGRVVGLNIARAGRVVSYALPASLVTSEMVGMLSEARAAAR